MGYKDPEKQREYMRTRYQRPEIKARQNLAKREENRRTREWFRTFKATQSCARCGESRPAALDFHHRDPSQKKYNIAAMVTRLGWAKLKAELEKCEVLCANCHRVEHAARIGRYP